MDINGVFKIFRTAEWWENKIPAILAIGYVTALKGDLPLIQMIPSILFVFMSIVVGAIYVSTINDLTDIQEDLKSGKNNRMSKIPSRYRCLIPFICVLFGLSFFYSYLPDTLSAILYFLPWVSFSLYSFKPIRLKQRGIWGLFADACGAHLFISLLMVSSISYTSKQPLDMIWFFLVGFWSLCFGLRGILWHQFYDRDHDLKVNLTTFATGITPDRFKKAERILFAFELLFFAGILIKLSISILTLSLFIYFGLAFFRYKALGHKLVIVLNPKNSPLQILMLDFYQIFFPVGILLYTAFTQKFGWVLLLFHLILFPRKLINIISDGLIILKSIKKKFKTFIDLKQIEKL